jgi:hypothetical protein
MSFHGHRLVVLDSPVRASQLHTQHKWQQKKQAVQQWNKVFAALKCM